MNKRHYEHTLPNIRGSLSNTYEVTCVELFHLFQLEGPDGDVMYLHKFAKL